jgi:glycosyltransferase involved in cell wall biosynthesis
MKILFVLFSLDAGGVTTVSNILADEMVNAEHEVSYLSLTDDQEKQRTLEHNGFAVENFGYKKLTIGVFVLSFFRLFRFFLKNRQLDFVIVASAYPGIVTTAAAKLALNKAKILVNFHTHVSAYAATQRWPKKLFLALGKIVFRFTDICANVSHITAKDAADYFGLDHVDTLYNPLPVYHYPDDRNEHPPHQWLKDQHILPIIACSRLNDVKDYPLMFASLVHLKKLDQRYKLLILGKGELENELKNLAKEVNLSNDIFFAGYVTNQQEYMALGRFLWLTSKYEGFNMVLLEALSAGIPCVVTNTPPGIHEVLEDGKYGLLINSRDPEIIARETFAFDQLPKKPAEFYQSRAKDFLPEKSTDAYLNVYKNSIKTMV